MFNGAIMHDALLKQVAHNEYDKDYLWFEFGDQSVWLSITKLFMRLCYSAQCT